MPALCSAHRTKGAFRKRETIILKKARIAGAVCAATSTLLLLACTAAATPNPTAAPSTPVTSPTATPTPSAPAPSPSPSLPALDEGFIFSDALCTALAAADLDVLSPIGVTSASTLSTDQADPAGTNGRCYVSDAPYGVSMVLDFGDNLAGTADWLSPTWPSPCIGQSRAEVVTLGGYETALSYCTEYPLETGSARHYTAVATTPGGGVNCRLSTGGDVPAIAPETMNDLCAQAFERLQGIG